MRTWWIGIGVFAGGVSLWGQVEGEASAPERPALEAEVWTGEEVTPVVLGSVSLEESGPAVGLPFDIHAREETRTYFNTQYALSEGIALNWTGSHSPPDPGTTNPAYRTGIIRRVNLFRAFAGVPANVTENATYSAKSQEAALMMSIANTLSHTPTPATFPNYYTADGAEAAGKSNLFLGSNGSASIDGYIHDPGSNNLRVGHRNWILDPERAEMGTGDVPRVGPGQNRANCLWVIGTTQANPVTRDPFVAWPPSGYVPSEWAYPRWSFKQSGVDLSTATVAMTDADGNAIPLNVVYQPGAGDSFFPLVWEPSITLSSYTSPRTPPTKDEAYHVVVTAPVAGVPTEFRYTVVLFDSATPKAEITGVVYLDVNDNGQVDEGEALPHAPVIANGPGGEVRTFSRGNGCFSLAVESTGTYTLTHPVFPVKQTVQVAAASTGQSYAMDLPLEYASTRLSGRTVSDDPADELTFRVQGGSGFLGRDLVIYQEGTLSRFEDAEDGLEDVTAIVPGGETLNDLLDTGTAIDTRSFHFHHAGADDRGILLSGVQPSAGSVVRFLSQLTLATEDQVAQVGVRVNGSGSWTTLWSQAGDRVGESGFNARSVSLAAYAGSTIDVRFLYAFGFGSYFPQAHLGWLVDNIEITEDQAQGTGFVEIDRRDVDDGSDSLFTPGVEGDFRFQVVHHHAGGAYSSPLFELDVDTTADDTLHTMMTYQPLPSGEWCLDFEAVNFVPYAVDLTYGGSVAGPYQVDGAHAPTEHAPGLFRSMLPPGSVPGLRYYRFSAQP